MCCIKTIVKYLLFLVNLVVVVGALALVGGGVFLLITIRSTVSKILDNLDTPADTPIPSIVDVVPIIIISLGVVIFVIGFSGCCGAITETRCLLILYAIFMAILAGGMTYLAVTANSALSDITSTVEQWVQEQFDIHKQDPTKGFFFALETVFECCGADGEESYLPSSELFPRIPGTCCANPIEIPEFEQVSYCEPGTPTSPTFEGCSSKISGLIMTYARPVSTVLVIIICFEVVAMLFAMYLTCSISRNIKRRREQKTYY